MLIRFLLELGLFLIFGPLVLLQVIVPLWNNQRMFPMFRKKEVAAVESKLAEVNEEIETEESKLELEKKEKTLEELKARKKQRPNKTLIS